MDKVRIGIVGIGGMGTGYATRLYKGEIENAKLTAICDIKQDRLDWADEYCEGNVSLFVSFDELLDSGCVDTLIISTPHYFHPIMGIKCLQNGIHVLVEKPVGVYTKKIEELNEVAKSSDKVFGIMYNQRTNPVYQKVRDMINEGELGELTRVNWVITEWYRTQYYYNSGGWRATWEGEGGGVLLNQCPHQIDLLQWICGMPKRIRGFCDYGKYHDIEVEDDVTAFLEYENGATGVFITSTGEAPGTNRLEISGDKGKVVVEKDEITFYRNRVSMAEHRSTAQDGFSKPENWICKIPAEGDNAQHMGIIKGFVECIQTGKKLLAPGIEGINGLTISNAIHMSSWIDDWVELPIDADKYYEMLQDKIKKSNTKKDVNDIVLDVKGSH